MNQKVVDFFFFLSFFFDVNEYFNLEEINQISVL